MDPEEFQFAAQHAIEAIQQPLTESYVKDDMNSFAAFLFTATQMVKEGEIAVAIGEINAHDWTDYKRSALRAIKHTIERLLETDSTWKPSGETWIVTKEPK